MMKAFVFCLISALLGIAVSWGQQPDEQRGRTTFNDGAEVLTRGPVHEAFAGTVAFDPEPGIVTGGKPPGKANDKPGRNSQDKPAGKPTDVSAQPQGGAHEKPKVEQPEPQVEPTPQPTEDSIKKV